MGLRSIAVPLVRFELPLCIHQRRQLAARFDVGALQGAALKLTHRRAQVLL